jgi:hypothetical protein
MFFDALFLSVKKYNIINDIATFDRGTMRRIVIIDV